MEAKPLIVILGPTASGKTSLAVKLAEKYGGEIICADSRTVYRGLDIGTAKPTDDERARVPHWGLDLVEPNEKYTAANFQKYATKKIDEIRSRGHIPFLVGGTGLYIDSVIFDYDFPMKANDEQRALLEKMTLEKLYKYCIENNIELPENDKNKRYIIRSVEKNGMKNSRKNEPLVNTFIVGITTDKNILRTRIAFRIEQLLNNGVVEEAKENAEKYGWEHEAMKGNIYKLCQQYLNGQLTIDELKEKAIVADWQLVKRQITWFKRNVFIRWKSLQSAEQYIASLLAS
jgi:tRNA dimethylallyltransferase